MDKCEICFRSAWYAAQSQCIGSLHVEQITTESAFEEGKMEINVPQMQAPSSCSSQSTQVSSNCTGSLSICISALDASPSWPTTAKEVNEEFLDDNEEEKDEDDDTTLADVSSCTVACSSGSGLARIHAKTSQVFPSPTKEWRRASQQEQAPWKYAHF